MIGIGTYGEAAEDPQVNVVAMA